MTIEQFLRSHKFLSVALVYPDFERNYMYSWSLLHYLGPKGLVQNFIGKGKTPELAAEDWLRQIRGKTMVYNYYRDPVEIVIPEDLEIGGERPTQFLEK